MGLTSDRNDPELEIIDPENNMQMSYLTLSKEERDKGFVRPVRQVYLHEKCGTETKMALGLAETYARDPHFYGSTYCAACKDHFRVGALGQFVWVENAKRTDIKVGT